MKKLLVLALLLGALAGLFGQQSVAAATVERVASGAAPTETVVASMDCEMPVDDEGSRPCDGLTLDCIAAMGCVVPVALPGLPLSVERPAPARLASPGTTSSPLLGRDVTPEPEPPALLT